MNMKDRIAELERINAELVKDNLRLTEKQERKTGVKRVIDPDLPVENAAQFGTVHAQAFFARSLAAHPELKSNAGVLNAFGVRSMVELPYLSVPDALAALDAKLKQ